MQIDNLYEYTDIEIECDGSRCPENNSVVYPEIVGIGEMKVGVLGEAPYIEEEALGRPFVGPSGQVLREYFDLDSCTYYIFNTVSCLTYVNGEPLKPSKMTPEQYEHRHTMCRPFREQILDTLDDGSVIVACGKFAIHALFGDWKKKASTVPDFLEYKGKTFIVYSIYHPAYPLYRPSARVAFEELIEATGVFKEKDDYDEV